MMDLKSFTRRRLSPSNTTTTTPTHQRLGPLQQQLRRLGIGSSAMSLTRIFAASFAALATLFILSVMLRHQPSDRLMGFAQARPLYQQNATKPFQKLDGEFGNELSGILLDGLLAASGFDDAACTSRYQTYLYRKTRHKPSAYLISRLRSYEELHMRCGPGTESYTKALQQLDSGTSIGSGDCNYIVWIAFSGLGNRILSLASTFLYALLTNRVLLIDRGKDMEDLFCEPFPHTSWLLLLDFPLIDQFKGFDQKSPRCYGNMLKNGVMSSLVGSIPPYLYLHLVHDYDDQDKLFFCDEDQSVLAKVPWLIIKTDNYFVPSLFLIPSFDRELSNLFPQKGSVFHHIGRYLFHPSNSVWGLVTRYYQTYIAKANESIGIQIRVFDSRPGPLKHVMDQILACTLKEKLLPEVDLRDSVVTSSENPKLKAVLVTSLVSGYSENLQNMYWEHPTKTGEVVGVYQPSHEEYQQTEKQMHNRKAWAEMYLLSLTDVLVTSSWSTFGYVAQGLGGVKPWILYKTENDTFPDPPCRLAMSMEPCFHAPPFYDCKAKTGIDTGKVVPHIRHCEDMSWGLKVVDDGHDVL